MHFPFSSLVESLSIRLIRSQFLEWVDSNEQTRVHRVMKKHTPTHSLETHRSIQQKQNPTKNSQYELDSISFALDYTCFCLYHQSPYTRCSTRYQTLVVSAYRNCQILRQIAFSFAFLNRFHHQQYQ